MYQNTKLVYESHFLHAVLLEKYRHLIPSKNQQGIKTQVALQYLDRDLLNMVCYSFQSLEEQHSSEQLLIWQKMN